ncbi:MAG: hypothetical protein CMN60_02680 [Sphingobium sp.]|nr:hypothetical protein [Sphingobium sp.]MBS46656.1 hypothetical protein [Sphingobium sp.]
MRALYKPTLDQTCISTIADALGIVAADVTVELGASDLPPSICAGRAWTTASAGSAIHLACKWI